MRRFLCTTESEEPRVHWITAGDFTGLLPFFEKYIFEAPQMAPDKSKKAEQCEPENKISRSSSITADEITGFHLWRKI